MNEYDPPNADDSVALVFASCMACGRVFGFNPHKVPSVTINGNREPVCSHCMGLVNQKRVKAGLPPHPILPDAYSPIPIREL